MLIVDFLFFIQRILFKSTSLMMSAILDFAPKYRSQVLLTTTKEGSMDTTSVFSFFNVPHGLFILSIVPGL